MATNTLPNRPPQSRESNVDVLIVGAGPTGLMCAYALMQAGANVRIVDKRPECLVTGQADGIQPRTIEVLQSYGLGDRLLREGNHIHMATIYIPNSEGDIESTGRIPVIGTEGTRYPFLITLNQGAIEALFCDAIHSLGFDVHRSIVPTSIELSQDNEELANPTSHPVKVVLQHLDCSNATEIVHAKFMIGTDGAHSWVRKALDIAMEGEQTEYIWGALDMVPITNFPDTRIRATIRSPNGSCMLIPREDDKIRLYVQLSDEDILDPLTGRSDKDRMSPEKLLEAINKTFSPFKMERPLEFDWWTVYISERLGQRVASTFSVKDRIFIAGDACHTHSPKAGQGMNAGMSDAHNLAWKLTQVLRGWSDISLLKTYEFERRRYAQDLINFDKEYATLFSCKGRTETKIEHENLLKAQNAFGGFITGIGVQYCSSSIIIPTHQWCAENILVGQRMPPQIFVRASDGRPYELQDLLPADMRFKILLFLGNTADPSQLEKVQLLAKDMESSESFLRRYLRNDNITSMFDILTILAEKKELVNIMDLPKLFRLHWSQVFVDDLDVTRSKGGQGYSAFGIDPSQVTLVVVRPDGVVGMVAPSESIDDVNGYFASFMKSSEV
ncbi:hypothetical protein SERLADRAFT_362748 [Serpula lacrymans var. lacrymans S7.9]|uniref:FAD-binding domain-containing protein n=1 Tax=Serpula lacrymans var. lacrymans (strain S7.9) TaxID=578457 RepID=F8P331_SERL9|nr:uncharacterized protein SERLADRAFT_362748 [Serpula lacrymans var. lacrymans S7.9]EGO22562.1 hypothetical protein SERLADRAFT_362748 [Serpula lacrymans var. lacrymans S7.9]